MTQVRNLEIPWDSTRTLDRVNQALQHALPEGGNQHIHLNALPLLLLPLVIPVTIAINGTTSTAATGFGPRQLVGIGMPAGWTAGDLAIHSSIDGGTYAPMYDQYDGEVKIDTTYLSTTVARNFSIRPVHTIPWQFIKVVADAAQGAARTINLIFRAVP